MNRLTGDFKGVSMFATVEQARQYNRLRQYEDTGLTPDEIAALRAELSEIKEWRKQREAYILRILAEDAKHLNELNRQVRHTKKARKQRDTLKAKLEAAQKRYEELQSEYDRALEESHNNWQTVYDYGEEMRAELDAAQRRAEAADGLIDRALVFISPAPDGSRAVERARVIMQDYCDRRGPDAQEGV